MIFGAIVIIALDELIAWKPFVLDYVKWGFGLLGMFGTQLAQEKWGQFKKGLSKLLDVKANISDAVTGKTTDVNDAIIKGTEATNTDVSQTPNP